MGSSRIVSRRSLRDRPFLIAEWCDKDARFALCIVVLQPAKICLLDKHVAHISVMVLDECRLAVHRR